MIETAVESTTQAAVSQTNGDGRNGDGKNGNGKNGDCTHSSENGDCTRFSRDGGIATPAQSGQGESVVAARTRPLWAAREGRQTTAPVSQARLDANRANAQKSTGPRTPEGKARVARNAIKHGLLCREAVLEFDDPQEFEEFQAALWIDLKPLGAMEELLAERLIAGHWRLKRAIHLDTSLMERDVLRAARQELKHDLRDVRPAGKMIHPVAVGEALQESMGKGPCAFELVRRYERTIQRDLRECLRELGRLQGSRAERAGLEGPAVGFESQDGDGKNGDCTHSSENGDCPRFSTGSGASSATASPGATAALSSSRVRPDVRTAAHSAAVAPTVAPAGGFVPQRRQALDEALAEFVSQVVAAGK